MSDEEIEALFDFSQNELDLDVIPVTWNNINFCLSWKIIADGYNDQNNSDLTWSLELRVQ